jgi:peptidoglycan/LPS O-acetylase OafA/YrhL
MLTSVQKFDPKNNSIGFLRLILAIAVVYSHSFALGGYGLDFIKNITHRQYSIGSFAVDGFFACSGYLITASYLRSQSFTVFLWHRFLRLMPGYWVVITFGGLILPLLLSKTPSFKYVINNFFVPVRSIVLLIINSIDSLLLSTPDLKAKMLFIGQLSIQPLFVNKFFLTLLMVLFGHSIQNLDVI